jgi:hypothetical protein
VNIPALRDRVTKHLSERLPGVKVCGSYNPVLLLDPDECAVVVQPVSLVVAFADRTKRECEPRLSVTVSRLLGGDRDAVADAVLVMVERIVAELHGASFGGFVCRTCEVADPILSETVLAERNAATAQLVCAFYGQQERKRD